MLWTPITPLLFGGEDKRLRIVSPLRRERAAPRPLASQKKEGIVVSLSRPGLVSCGGGGDLAEA